MKNMDRHIASRLGRLMAVLALSCAMFAVVASTAAAARLQTFESASFSTQEAFGKPTGVAVDQATGNVYVADDAADVVDVFGSEGGSPVGGVPAQITGHDGLALPGGEPAEVAVDNACYAHGLAGSACAAAYPSNGDVYVAESQKRAIVKFKPNTLGTEYELAETLSVSGEPNGVAVDTEGDVYVANYNAAAIAEFNSSGVEVGKIEQGTVSNPGYIAVGAPGVLYVGDYNGGVAKIQVNSTLGIEHEELLTGEGKAVAVDSHGNAYVDDEGSRIVVYGPSGTLSEEFGSESFEGSQGVAVNDTAEDVYVANGEAKNLLAFGVPTVEGPAPVVITQAAKEELGTTATVTGKVNPEGTSTKYWFAYGLTEAYESTTTHKSAGQGTTASEVEAAVENLQPSTTYHYRLLAQNAFGEKSEGSDETFTTAGAPPAISGDSATAVTSSDATLSAEVNPESKETTYHFEYGLSATLSGASSVGEASLPPAFEADRAGPVDIGGGLEPNTTYYYRVVASNGTTNGNGTTYGPIGSFITAPLPPTAASGEASGVTATTAILSGVLNGMGTDTHYFFSYGLTESYGSGSPENAPSQSFNAGVVASDTSETVELTDLTPNTTYHYQFVAFNAESCSRFLPGFPINCSPPENIAYGQDREFTTLPLAPAVTSDPAVGVGASTATVTGRVVPQGVDAAYRFEYGSTTAYGSSVPLPEGNVSGSTVAEEVTLGLSDLQPGVTYHYRLVSTNTGGQSDGADETFTTNGPATPGAEPLPSGFSLTGTAPPGPAATVFPSLAAVTPPTTAKPPVTSVPPTPRTRIQQLSKALKSCKKDKSRAKRLSCEKQAKKRYGAGAKKK